MRSIDLRSDTVTLPSLEMRQAMFDAPLGDDVIDVDPTVQRLQEEIAARLGHEAAIFMPSGTMTNQVALRLHCRPGDEFLCEDQCHIYHFEQGAFAQLSGLVARPLAAPGNLLRVEDVAGMIRPDSEHMVRTRLLCLENTHNLGGGRVMPFAQCQELCAWARDHDLATHLDGARLFNAVVATGVDAAQWGQLFDTVSVCFSKGLGAPVGSALVGSREMIAVARRHRKLFGGNMRQAGVIAAGALYALEHHVERLAEDHQTAQILAEGVRRSEGLELSPGSIDTNIVIIHVDPQVGTARELIEFLAEQGVHMMAFGPQAVRAVTHYHITPDDAQRASQVLQAFAGRPR